MGSPITAIEYVGTRRGDNCEIVINKGGNTKFSFRPFAGRELFLYLLGGFYDSSK